jgi:predicted RNA binding protein YcfA (HicA-like mRNA interferase family)
MGKLNPVSRRELIVRLQKLGFDGPYTGGRHEFMVHNQLRLILPNPHQSDIGVGLLSRLLHQAGLSRDEWEQSA